MSTNRIPLTMDLSSARGLPSLARGGRRGSMTAHLSSSSSSNFIVEEDGPDASQRLRQDDTTIRSSFEIGSMRLDGKVFPRAPSTGRWLSEELLSGNMKDRKADVELTRLCLSAIVFYALRAERSVPGSFLSCRADHLRWGHDVLLARIFIDFRRLFVGGHGLLRQPLLFSRFGWNFLS
jgi:hypothetical protein